MDPNQQMLESLAYNVAVVDDFASDFEGLRQRALAAQYDPLGGGMFATGHYSTYAGDQDALDRISDAVGVRLIPASELGMGRFCLRTAAMTMGLDIHADDCLVGGILYLNLPQHCQGGTSIFRHKATGLYAFPTDEEQRSLDLAPQGNYFEYFCLQEGLDRSKWEEVLRVEMRPNRLVLIRGRLFHSHSWLFGDTLENGRLVQLYFLNSAADPTAGWR
jgi:hypothetical protein